jgi:cholesterol transport system auxiliary component
MLRPLLLALLLPGCAAISALDRAAEPLDAYEIRAPQIAAARAPQGVHFVVEVPSASGAIDTESILVRPSPVQVQYLPDARWTEAAPVMIQTAIIDTFLSANAFRYVGRRPLGSSGDIALVSNLTEFGARTVPGGVVVEMTLVARLVREDDAAVTASRTFTRSVAVSDTSDAAIVAGYEAVSNAVLSELAGWVLSVRGIAAGSS